MKNGKLSIDLYTKVSRSAPVEVICGWVLTHVLLHSAYHRGQVALGMRSAGLQPAYADFIYDVRQGFG